tara:strand:+ start:2951 stop:3598 length:648 start_codon:yes stop_codon:yes gene_type:complete
MQDYQFQFLEFVIEHQILRFGEFKLKSGRESPYFFNAGLFNSGKKLNFLAKSYADAIVESNLTFDILFGPAYKGIPLVATTAIALAKDHDLDKPFAFNRKEVKQHGEKGLVVGANLQGRVLVLDDVITAGTAIREVAEIIGSADAIISGIAVALDRQEKGLGELSAIQEIEQLLGTSVISIINLENIISYLSSSKDDELLKYLDGVVKYRELFGV